MASGLSFAQGLKFLAAASLFSCQVAVSQPTSQPTVQVRNGTYVGLYNHVYEEDMFLGVPFAQPPVGDLRYRNPVALNTTWAGSKNATQYSPECWGFGSDDWVLGNPVSEDCLTLNIVRPASGQASDTGLPVGVWVRQSIPPSCHGILSEKWENFGTKHGSRYTAAVTSMVEAWILAITSASLSSNP